MKLIKNLFLAFGLLVAGSMKAEAAVQVFEIINSSITVFSVTIDNAAWTVLTSSKSTHLAKALLEGRTALELQNQDASCVVTIQFNEVALLAAPGRTLAAAGGNWALALAARDENGIQLAPFAKSSCASQAVIVTQVRAK